MLTHSAAWDAYPASTFRPAVRVTAYGDSHLGPSVDVPVSDGWVLKDATQYPRSHAMVTTADTSLVPTTPATVLTPFGGWLRVEYGYTDTAGATTYITIFDGPITRMSADRPGGLFTIEASDPSVFASQKVPATDPAWDYVTNNQAWNLAQAAGQGWPLATWGQNGVNYAALTTAQTSIPIPTGYVWKAGQSCWSVCELMCDLMGAEAFYDTSRKLIVRPTPTIGAPVWTFSTGEGGTLTEYQTIQERTYNAVYLAYANGITGTWIDNGATSVMAPGYYGEYALYETRDGTPSQVDANNAAREYARRAKGTGRTTTLRSVPVPWLEPGDTVNVDPIGLPVEQHLIQSVTIPLTLDVMTITTRNAPYTGAI